MPENISQYVKSIVHDTRNPGLGNRNTYSVAMICTLQPALTAQLRYVSCYFCFILMFLEPRSLALETRAVGATDEPLFPIA